MSFPGRGRILASSIGRTLRATSPRRSIEPARQPAGRHLGSLTPARILASGLALASLPLWGPAAAPWASPAAARPILDWGDPGWGLDLSHQIGDSSVGALGLTRSSTQAAKDGACPTRWSCVELGVSPRYLAAVARAESGFVSRAHASTSSAAGPFQFIDQTWLLTLHRYGRSLGLGLEASFIRIGPDGRARVGDRQVRAALLALRYDPAIAGAMAAALTRENGRTLGAALGRPPTGAELYAAHLLGAGQALQLLAAYRLTPAYPAAELFPVAASGNPHLFFAAGAPRTVRDLVEIIVAKTRFGGPPFEAWPTEVLAGDELVNLAPESASY